MSWKYGGWGEKCQKWRKGEGLCGRRMRTASIFGVLDAGLYAWQYSKWFASYFLIWAPPQACEVDIIYCTDKEREAQKSDLPKLVMVETASLVWEIHTINSYAVGKCRSKVKTKSTTVKKNKESLSKDHSPGLFFFHQHWNNKLLLNAEFNHWVQRK